MTRYSHHRWSVGLAATLLLVSVGLLYGSSSPFLLAVVSLGYVAYGALSSYPEPVVEIERSLSPETPTPGSTVTVTVTVTNDGQRTLADARVVDAVPDELAVVSETPRAGLSIPPGESRAFTYEVMAKRGEYVFGSPTIRVRSLSGSRIVTETVDPSGTSTLTCSTTVEGTPLERTARERTGTLPTDSGGPGLEFHSTRDYRPGDPISRLDWRRLARTDELSTVNFREERATRLIVVLDARPPTRIAPHPGYPTGAGLAAYAGERVYEALRSAGHQVGVTALGVETTDLASEGGLPWVDPTAEGGSAAAARTLFEDAARAQSNASEVPDPTQRSDDSAESAFGEQLLARLAPGAQVLVVSPLLDEEPVALTGLLRTHGVPVTVLSPDVTVTDTAGGRLGAIRRQNAVTRLQYRGVTVIEWPPTESLEVVLDRSLPAVIP